MRKSFLKSLSICLLSGYVGSIYAMDIAITVDDIPANGELPSMQTRTSIAKKMLSVFRKHHLKRIYGFINGAKVGNQENLAILGEWVKQGQLLGNHTYHHADLDHMKTDDYLLDIKQNETILSTVMGDRDYRYFRYPYLSEGNTREKREGTRHFLFQHHYKIAQVTTEFFDYEWNDAYVRCEAKHDVQSIEWLKKTYIEQAINALTISHALSMMLYNRDIKNILLIHINAFTTEMLDELLTTYKAHGVNFISLDNALSDEVYNFNPNLIRDRTYTFLNQVRVSRGLGNPDIVNALYDSLPEEQLDKICR